jgi:hypothetical protein
MLEYDQIYESSYTMLTLMRSRQLAIPLLLQRNMETVFQYKIEQMLDFSKGYAVLGRLKRYAVEVRKWNVQLDTERLAYLADSYISYNLKLYNQRIDRVEWAQRAFEFLETLYAIGVNPSINKLQDFIFRLAIENHLEPELRQAISKLAFLINLELPLKSVSNGHAKELN